MDGEQGDHEIPALPRLTLPERETAHKVQEAGGPEPRIRWLSSVVPSDPRVVNLAGRSQFPLSANFTPK